MKEEQEKYYTEVYTNSATLFIDIEYEEFIQLIKGFDFISFKENKKHQKYTINKKNINGISIFPVSMFERMNERSGLYLTELDMDLMT